MAKIVATPEQLKDFGTKFDNSSNQVQDLLTQVQNLVNTLQGGEWQGNRASKFYNDWGAMKTQVTKAIETLRQASQLLKNAGNDFGGVDNR
jgi:WXG100 family type VII secretion target